MNLVEWYTEQRASETLGVSTRTVRRMAEDGALRRAWRPLAGRKPEAVYHPEDVEREKQSMRPRPVPVEDTQAPLVVRQPPGADALERFGEFLRRGPAAQPALWLTIEAASEYSGLSQALLRRLIADGKLAAIGDAAIKVRRSDLEQLDPANLAAAAPLDRLRGRTRVLLPAPSSAPRSPEIRESKTPKKRHGKT